jgi:hypothetical protein
MTLIFYIFPAAGKFLLPFELESIELGMVGKSSRSSTFFSKAGLVWSFSVPFQVENWILKSTILSEYSGVQSFMDCANLCLDRSDCEVYNWRWMEPNQQNTSNCLLKTTEPFQTEEDMAWTVGLSNFEYPNGKDYGGRHVD